MLVRGGFCPNLTHLGVSQRSRLFAQPALRGLSVQIQAFGEVSISTPHRLGCHRGRFAQLRADALSSEAVGLPPVPPRLASSARTIG